MGGEREGEKLERKSEIEKYTEREIESESERVGGLEKEGEKLERKSEIEKYIEMEIRSERERGEEVRVKKERENS